MAGNVITQYINGEDISKGFNPVLASYTVSGAPVTSIDFSGLDINAHGGSYEIEMRLINGTATSSTIYAHINNDTTLANYSAHYVDMTNGIAYGFGATGMMISTLQNSTTAESFSISKIALRAGKPLLTGMVNKGYNGTAYGTQLVQSQKNTTVTNITQLTFTASVASSIGVGSQIIIRRKDK